MTSTGLAKSAITMWSTNYIVNSKTPHNQRVGIEAMKKKGPEGRPGKKDCPEDHVISNAHKHEPTTRPDRSQRSHGICRRPRILLPAKHDVIGPWASQARDPSRQNSASYHHDGPSAGHPPTAPMPLCCLPFCSNFLDLRARLCGLSLRYCESALTGIARSDRR
ncbi:hypothetical protein DENSPDRAFT_160289 [Dentipellis sp. KUC8613]|nr:hypothetical protein DENSPDRAFT_160289 [Dentipellis sp. KUC8613]